MGERIIAGDDGYDHNFGISKNNNTLELVVTLSDILNERKPEVTTIKFRLPPANLQKEEKYHIIMGYKILMNSSKYN